MGTDRELLEAAAKAAFEIHPDLVKSPEWWDGFLSGWNPLEDDAHALRLAVKLRLKVEINDASIVISRNVSEWESDDPLYEYPEGECDDNYNIRHVNHDKATRRAIVRAAAALGSRHE